MHADQVGQHFNLFPILSYKNGVPNSSIRHEVQYKSPVASGAPMGVASLVCCLHCGVTASTATWWLLPATKPTTTN